MHAARAHRRPSLATRAQATAQWCRREWKTILLLPATPHQIALGVAVGVFVAVTPTPGLQMLLAGLLAASVGGSIRAALPMVWLSNPLTAAPILYATYVTGRVFWPWAPRLTVEEMAHAVAAASRSTGDLLQLGGQVLAPLAIGGVVIGAALGLAAYPLILLLVRGTRPRAATPRPGPRAAASLPELAATRRQPQAAA